MPQVPSLFIGSSTEGLRVAQELRSNLEKRQNPDKRRIVIPTLWTDGIFRLGESVPDRIIETAATFDFAALVFSPDDVVLSRGIQNVSPRDNIVFELGLFAGQLGRARCFAVVHDPDKPKLPSDFAGVSHATYTMEKDGEGKETPSVGAACDDIVKAVERLGKLRHPVLEMEKTLDQIVMNHRRAFKVDHPLFQEYLRRWCLNEREDSEFWKQGLLRVKVDFADVFISLYTNAKKNIFSTSIPDSRFVWNEFWGKRLLKAQSENKSAASIRVFVYQQEHSVTDEDVRIMRQHQDAGIDVRVYFDSRGRGFSYEATNIESEWHMIDDGQAIGVTKSIEPGAIEVHWFFADKEQIDKYKWLKAGLLNWSITFNDWVTQRSAA
jgi:hypothetical protein